MIEEDIKSNVITGFGDEMCPGANECRQPLNAWKGKDGESALEPSVILLTSFL